MSTKGVAPVNADVLDGNGRLALAWSDFLDKLGRNLAAIGDYRQSARKDIGDGWLPCNGAYVAYADYPELGRMIGALMTTTGDANLFRLPTLPAYYGSSGGSTGGTGEPPVMQWWVKAR